jgi:L-aspartate oxidase
MDAQYPKLPNLRVEAPRWLVDPEQITAQKHTSDLVVIGGGLAGLSVALRAAAHLDVTILARQPSIQSNSAWAQGGIAAALAPDDSPAAHTADTLVAGAGLCDEAAVEMLTHDGPRLMYKLVQMGVPFAREDGHFQLGLEGGHGKRRILHVDDATGWAVTKVLMQQALEHPRIRFFDSMQVVDLLGDGVCQGALALDQDGNWHRFEAPATVLASGGTGALFGLSSNPASARGEGMAMAYRAGAEVADMEMVQFHPTVFRTRSGQGFLISEAARGEGGLLFTPSGVRFMPDYDPRAELAPRDVVTRGIFRAMREYNCDSVLLDLTGLGSAFLEARFPTIVAKLRSEGIEPTRERIPIAPAAHYMMGGIRSDLNGATNLPGLYVAGECACTGVHGANRLASNSLLECLVFGIRAAEHILSQPKALEPLGPRRKPALPRLSYVANEQLTDLMQRKVGPIRQGQLLTEARQSLEEAAAREPQPDTLSPHERYSNANALLVARLMANSALLRCESRGGHFRSDFPASDAAWQAHIIQGADQAPSLAQSIACLNEALA